MIGILSVKQISSELNWPLIAVSKLDCILTRFFVVFTQPKFVQQSPQTGDFLNFKSHNVKLNFIYKV